jgi:uncharacterized membrane protein SpoIIM required for sporulation
VLDIDRFIDRHRQTWLRLESLSASARRGPKTMAPGEVEELIQCYQQVSGHLAHARAAYDDPGLLARLNRIVADANAVIYGRRARAGSSFTTFFRVTFPATVWQCRRAIGAAAACLFVPAIVLGVWVASSEAARDASLSPEERAAYVATEFEDYYSQAPAQEFASHVTVNNIQVSVLAFAGGAFAALPGAALLAVNGANLGVAGGVFADAGQIGKFLGLITPHGLLELTAIAITAGAGLRIGWAMLAPGDRRRSDALSEEGRRAIALVLGCTLLFVVAGLIEGFVTPSSLPTGARVAVGVLVELAFLAYVLGQGRARALDLERAAADRR